MTDSSDPGSRPVRERLADVASRLLDVDLPEDVSVSRIATLAASSRSAISKNYRGLDHLLTVAAVKLMEVELKRLDNVSRQAGLTGWDVTSYRVLGLHRWVETRIHLGELLFDSGQFEHPLTDVPIRSTVLGHQIALDFGERPVTDATLTWIAAVTMSAASTALLSVLGEWEDLPQYREVGRRIIAAPSPEDYKQWKTDLSHPAWTGLFEMLGKGTATKVASDHQAGRAGLSPDDTGESETALASKRGRRRGQTETPTLLIRSALELVESGVALQSISIQELTRRVHHAPSSVYTHFESFDALLHEARKAWSAILNNLEKSIQTSSSPLERVIRRFGVLMNDAAARPEIYREILFRKPRKDPWPFSFQAALDLDLVQGAAMDLFAMSTSGALPTDVDLATYLRGFIVLFRTVSCVVINQAQQAAPRTFTPELLAHYVQNALTLLLFGVTEPSPELQSILDQTQTLLGLH